MQTVGLLGKIIVLMCCRHIELRSWMYALYWYMSSGDMCVFCVLPLHKDLGCVRQCILFMIYFGLGVGVSEHASYLEQEESQTSARSMIEYVIPLLFICREARRLLTHASAKGVENSDKIIEKYCEQRMMCDD